MVPFKKIFCASLLKQKIHYVSLCSILAIRLEGLRMRERHYTHGQCLIKIYLKFRIAKSVKCLDVDWMTGVWLFLGIFLFAKTSALARPHPAFYLTYSYQENVTGAWRWPLMLRIKTCDDLWKCMKHFLHTSYQGTIFIGSCYVMIVIFKEIGIFQTDILLVQYYSNSVPQYPCDRKSAVNELARNATIFNHNNLINLIHYSFKSHYPYRFWETISRLICTPSAKNTCVGMAFRASAALRSVISIVDNWNYAYCNTFCLFAPSFHEVRTGNTIAFIIYQTRITSMYQGIVTFLFSWTLVMNYCLRTGRLKKDKTKSNASYTITRTGEVLSTQDIKDKLQKERKFYDRYLQFGCSWLQCAWFPVCIRLPN